MFAVRERHALGATSTGNSAPYDLALLNKLILINQAKDSLDTYDINYLKNVLKETKNFKNKNLKSSRNIKITSNLCPH